MKALNAVALQRTLPEPRLAVPTRDGERDTRDFPGLKLSLCEGQARWYALDDRAGAGHVA
jgi:hypothetical protein